MSFPLRHPELIQSTVPCLSRQVLTLNSPLALITPAKSHPEVIVQAVAARDRTRAEEFAKKHGIPDVKDSYQGMCDSWLLSCTDQSRLTLHAL